MLDPVVEWATAPGPPNLLFVVALLTAPHLWSRYVKRTVRELYEQRFGGDDA